MADERHNTDSARRCNSKPAQILITNGQLFTDRPDIFASQFYLPEATLFRVPGRLVSISPTAPRPPFYGEGVLQ